jgi:N-acetylmuramic acid 6-phosphate etherase
MNAGTAQRITLNLLSSLVMIRLGRVYQGLMVDVQASNVKLARRREAIVRSLTGRSGAEARDALCRADGSVKLAVLLLHGSDLAAARAALDRAGGQLRGAIDLIASEPPQLR